MIALTSPSPFRFLRSGLALFALAAALSLPCTVKAQADSDPNKKQLSEKVREGMGKFGPLQDAKKWDEAIALLNDLLKVAQPDTYDQFLLNYVKGQVYLSLEVEQQPLSIAPLETALSISDRQGFFDNRELRKVLMFLAQLYNGIGSAKGVLPAAQQGAYAKASTYLDRLLESERSTHELNPDHVLFAAYLVLQRAQANPEKPDLVLMKQSQKITQEGLLLAIAPKPEFYRLLLSTQLSLNDYASAAELLELMLKKDPKGPKSKDDWTQLTNIYLNLGLDDKDKEKAMDNNVRAIVTYERAQANGFMNTPKDNFQLVATYYNIGQVEQAARLLETHLKKGTIESDQKYWTYLAQWYQQVNQEPKALETLIEAAKHFPNAGDFDYMAAVNYYALEKYDEVIKFARQAASKGMGEKTWQAWALVAYTSNELRKYEDALEAVTKALSYPDSKKDSQLPGLQKAAEAAIKEHAAQTEALKAAKQQ